MTRIARRRGALAAAVTVATLLLALAATAHAAVWTVGPTSEVFPFSQALSAQSITLYAAGNEYESAQIALRGQAGSVSLSWAAGSDPLLVSNSCLFRVVYVTTTRASQNEHLRVGQYPDPLPPVSFGTPIAIPATTTSFFLTIHVPYDSQAGTYTGTIDVTQGSGTTAVPVSVRVWDFGWQQLSMHTAFPLSIESVMDSVRGTGASQATLLPKYYEFWEQHGLSPGVLFPGATVNRSTGHASTTGLAAGLSPWLNSGGPAGTGFLDTRLPLSLTHPWTNWGSDRSRIETYVTDLVRFYRENGWAGRTYAYVVDEPMSKSSMHQAQLVGSIIHTASARAGFREPFLLTDEPRTQTVDGAVPNKFLWSQVDIWCPSMFHFWGDLPLLHAQQAAGKQVWWYSFASNWSGRYPAWFIDRPTTDVRATFWMASLWGVQGMLYWGTNDWIKRGTSTYRDPYKNTVSYFRSTFVANGEASFIYPGYEPSLGLNDKNAGPVSSLRMEALRSGLQDYQYYQIAQSLASRSNLPGVAAYPARIAAAITHFQYGAYPLQWHDVPVWSADPATYTNAKVHLGTFIERLQAGQGLVVARGTVTDAATGKPVAYATVSDGIVSATTATDGSFTLSGVLPQADLTISQPRYASAHVTYNEGDPAVTVPLTALRPLRMLSNFESAPAFHFRKAGTATLSTSYATSGRKSVKLVFRNWQTTWSLGTSAGRLGAFHELDLDVYNPRADVNNHEWFLYLTATDAHGRQIKQRILLAPYAWTHLRLSLVHGSFDRRAVRTIGMYLYPVRGQTIYVDTVFAK